MTPSCASWRSLFRLVTDHVATGASTLMKVRCDQCRSLVAKSHVGDDGALVLKIRRPAGCPHAQAPETNSSSSTISERATTRSAASSAISM